MLEASERRVELIEGIRHGDFRQQAGQAAVTTKAKITRDYLIDQTNDIMLKAKANGAWAAARGGNELLAKLTGHLVERRDLRVIRQMEDLTDDELEVLAGADRQQQAGDGSVH